MSRLSRTHAVRLSLVIAALLLPAQALAHCGVLLSGLHAHEHHPGAGPAPSHSEHGATLALSVLDMGRACALDVPVFTVRRSSEWGSGGQVMVFRVSSFTTLQATRYGKDVPFSPEPPAPLASTPLPLRI
jgi:hypothetical protein